LTREWLRVGLPGKAVWHPTHWRPLREPGSQPHDRTALDRHDAKTREKALREAADELRGQGYGAAVRTIIALITKGDCVIEKPQGGEFATNQSNGLATLQKEKPNDLS